MKSCTLAVLLFLILVFYIASCITVAILIKHLQLKQPKLTTKQNNSMLIRENKGSMETQNTSIKSIEASTTLYFEKVKTTYAPSLFNFVLLYCLNLSAQFCVV